VRLDDIDGHEALRQGAHVVELRKKAMFIFAGKVAVSIDTTIALAERSIQFQTRPYASNTIEFTDVLNRCCVLNLRVH
jgi:hypothetical protein